MHPRVVAERLSSDDIAQRLAEAGKLLAKYRQDAKLTQSQLAAKLAYHRSVIGHAEQGRGGGISARFWDTADKFFGTNGTLLRQYRTIYPDEGPYKKADVVDAARSSLECPSCRAKLSLHCGISLSVTAELDTATDAEVADVDD